MAGNVGRALTELPGRADPVDVLLVSNAARMPDVAPIRIGRMLASPFAFLRGSAQIMAYDLASGPSTDLEVRLCGSQRFLGALLQLVLQLLLLLFERLRVGRRTVISLGEIAEHMGRYQILVSRMANAQPHAFEFWRDVG